MLEKSACGSLFCSIALLRILIGPMPIKPKLPSQCPQNHFWKERGDGEKHINLIKELFRV
jgi:hypothetical protein